MKKIIILLSIVCVFQTTFAQNRWQLVNDGGISQAIKAGESNTDHIELSGKHLSVILT